MSRRGTASSTPSAIGLKGVQASLSHFLRIAIFPDQGSRWTSGRPEFVRLEITENLYDPDTEDPDVPELTQRWVNALTPILQRRIREWHMMQAVFVEDLDPERLERARQRAAQKGH